MHDGMTVISFSSSDCFENMGPQTEGSDLSGFPTSVFTVKECRDMCLQLLASNTNCHGFTVRQNFGTTCQISLFSSVEGHSVFPTSVFYKKVC